MHFSTFIASLGLLASFVLAAPQHQLSTKRSSSGQNAVYWGQNGGGTIENNDLAAYCGKDSGIDILVLAFLYQFGASGIPSGVIGQSCAISTSGEGQNCANLTTAIATCKSAGVKIILSLGGASASYSLTSDDQASQIGQYLWDSYGNSGNKTVQRPFGDNIIDGFDFDIETSSSSQYFPAMIKTLRTAFESDSANKYYITGAPQCPIPEPNMGSIIGNATFDYLFVQWYNNNGYAPDPCALPFNNNTGDFNYKDWVNFTSTTPSKDAEIFIGVPASTTAANGTPAGATYYITPAQLAELISKWGSATRFGGIMMWSAGFSDSNVIDNCTYAQQAHSILTTGSPCGGGSGSGSDNSSSTSSAMSTAAMSTSMASTMAQTVSSSTNGTMTTPATSMSTSMVSTMAQTVASSTNGTMTMSATSMSTSMVSTMAQTVSSSTNGTMTTASSSKSTGAIDVDGTKLKANQYMKQIPRVRLSYR